MLKNVKEPAVEVDIEETFIESITKEPDAGIISVGIVEVTAEESVEKR